MLDNEDKFLIILEAIKDYRKGENDIAILLVEKLTQKLITIEVDTDTVELYKEIEDTFNLYNQFIKIRNVDMPFIPDEMYDLVVYYFNKIIEELK